MARDVTDTLYNGRRRLSGNFGKLWVNGALIFEISAFSAKVTADRDDVYIGADKDSKITGLTGEGSFTIKQVFTRGFNRLLENWKNGHDERFVFIGELADPDTVGGQYERVRLENIAINELDIMKFEKGAVIEKEISFRWTPSDTFFEDAIEIPEYAAPHENF